MEQIERIKQMEQRLNQASKAITDLSSALEQYAEALNHIQELNAYYGSNDWKLDCANDEAGLLPKNLKRGVLSEDAIWNLLADNRDLLVRMKNLLQTENSRVIDI